MVIVVRPSRRRAEVDAALVRYLSSSSTDVASGRTQPTLFNPPEPSRAKPLLTGSCERMRSCELSRTELLHSYEPEEVAQMSHLVLQFSRDDEEFRSAIESEFADNVAVAEIKSFDGVEYIQAVVTVVLPLAPSIVDFLVHYLRERKKRIVLTPEGEISLDNYSIDEAKDLLLRITEGRSED
jgi:hypothetical protein